MVLVAVDLHGMHHKYSTHWKAFKLFRIYLAFFTRHSHNHIPLVKCKKSFILAVARLVYFFITYCESLKRSNWISYSIGRFHCPICSSHRDRWDFLSFLLSLCKSVFISICANLVFSFAKAVDEFRSIIAKSESLFLICKFSTTRQLVLPFSSILNPTWGFMSWNKFLRLCLNQFLKHFCNKIRDNFEVLCVP